MPAKLDVASVEALARTLRTLLDERHLEVPLAGEGATWDRFARLLEFSAVDLSLGRLVEGHTDALAILAEARGAAREGKLYGVWAAEPPDAVVEATTSDRGFRLRGLKRYCSGARTLDRALVTARNGRDSLLFDLDVRANGVRPLQGTWHAVGMANSDSLDVQLDVEVPASACVGAPGFYVARRGFWHGAVGVAACWLGGAVGCARLVKRRLVRKSDDYAAAHFGAIVAECHAMRVALVDAAREIDGIRNHDPAGERRALIARQIVEQGCQRVLAATGRAAGTAPLVFDTEHARRAADLVVYLRQHHAERDGAALARVSLGDGDWP
jgi:alkylation response protein AidB-like acyl-CoA dehydrogenase